MPPRPFQEARTQGRIRRHGRTRAVVVTSIVALVAASALVALVVRIVSRAPESANLGPRVFHVGRIDRLAAQIDDGGPLLFKDTLDRDRDIYVHHHGQEPDEGWVAVEAYAPGSARTPPCILEWRAREAEFADPCSDATFPATGAGLIRYKTSVADRRLTVDLRQRLAE